jgi:RNA polymerase sigma-70 factor (ECF subfamily)
MRYRNLSDQDLFCLLQEGDCRAYTEIYNRYSESLYAHALKRLNNREEAKDIIQELYTYIWVNRAKISIQGRISSYLYKATRNRVINVLAHREVATNYIVSLEQEIPNYKEHADYLIRENQLAGIIEREISFLPSKMKEVFILSRKRYLSNREIAHELNISELTVKKQVANALKILRSRLDVLIRCFIYIIPFL